MTMTSGARQARRAAKKADPNRISLGRALTWASTGGTYASAIMLLGYFSIYATDTLGLNPAIVGGILFVSKIVDAVGMLFAGWFVDRAPETRWGKARPFELAIVGVWAAAAGLFSVPGGLGEVAKYVWVFVAYLLVTAIFAPLLNANDPLYLARAFGNRDAITKIQMSSTIFTGIFAVLTSIGLPFAISAAGNNQGSWTFVAWCLAIPMTIFGLLRFLFHKERYQTESASKPKATFGDIVAVLKSNPFLWGVAGINFVTSFVGGIGVGAYYYTYVIGDLSLQSIAGFLSLALLPVLLVIPRLARRYTVSRVILWGNLMSAFGYLLFSFGQHSLLVLVAAGLFSGLGAAPIASLLPVLIVDNATYNEWKGNRRLESVGGSVTGFSANVAGAVAAGIAGIVLAAFGYDGSADVQSPAATTAIIGLASWLPAALSIASAFVAMSFRRFERQLPTITREIEIRRLKEDPDADWALSFQTVEDRAEIAEAIELLPDGGDAAAGETDGRKS